MQRLANKVAIITGASSGIGASIARRFAEEGAHIYAFDIREPCCEDWQVAAEIADEFQFVQGDIRVESSIKNALQNAADQHGVLDIVVNAVGVTGSDAGDQLDVKEWDRILNVNLRSIILTCYHALDLMAKQGHGNIINVTSLDGLSNREVISAYNTAKGGLIAASRNFALQYSRQGIRVNVVCPGVIETPAFSKALEMPGKEPLRDNIVAAQQMGRLGKPVEVANAALFLASDEASYITGHSLVVDGGLALSQHLSFPGGQR